MKLKSAIKYQLSSIKKSVIIFYSVIIGLLLIIRLINLVFSNDNTKVGNMDLATIIFLLVVGLNSFKEPFNMMLANGVSRQTMFKSFVMTALPVAAFMALVDIVIYIIMNLLSAPSLSYTTIFGIIYNPRYASDFSLPLVLEGLLWMFFMYAAVTILGYLIATLYYRMNKAVKVIFSIGVPGLFFIILPLIDTALFSGMIFRTIGNAMLVALGITAGYNPYIAMLSFAAAFIILGGFSFLTMRKATVKKT